MITTLIIVTGIAVTTLGIVWMGISFVTNLTGTGKGATKREIEALQEHVNHIQEEIISLKKEVRQLIQIAKGSE
ncbi:MAG: hypothetical protein OXM61_21195 [Candidatus Poribacteria bacterium]|nr:hypothetical protein [Candidatus Poribacteria bacterium]